MPFADLDDVRLHYVLEGPLDAPLVVLSNSLGTNLAMWDRQLPLLAQHLRVLRYDTRGHGQSSIPPGPYRLQTLANDVLHLMDSLDITKAAVCGVSLGGMTALWLGIHAAERLTHLVPANTAPRIGTEESWNARISQVDTDGMASLVDGTLERWFTAPFRAADPLAIATTRQMLLTTSASGYGSCCAAIRDMDLTDTVDQIKIPALILAGTHDPVTPPVLGRMLAEKIEGADYLELNAAHLSNIEQAQAFAGALLKFLLG